MHRTMDGIKDIEHDRWIEKISNALQSFKVASQRKAELAQGRPSGAAEQATDRQRS